MVFYFPGYHVKYLKSRSKFQILKYISNRKTVPVVPIEMQHPVQFAIDAALVNTDWWWRRSLCKHFGEHQLDHIEPLVRIAYSFHWRHIQLCRRQCGYHTEQFCHTIAIAAADDCFTWNTKTELSFSMPYRCFFALFRLSGKSDEFMVTLNSDVKSW